YGGHFARCIEQSDGSAVDFVELVVKSFPSYRDEAVYDGQRVSFCKRAQILDGLTMFVDYRVPQMLSHKGVLVYSSALKGQLQRKKLILYGDPDEYEIRAESILTVHLIVNHANEKILLEKDTDVEQRLNAPFVDAYLWKKDENKLIYTNKHHFIVLDQYSINYFFFSSIILIQNILFNYLKE
ncbi:unnamed protein product, partial [Rotaria sordida]